MKKFVIWLSVNDGEYYSRVVFYGNHCEALHSIEMNNEVVFPVMIDDKVVYFDEKVEVEVE